MRSAKPIPPPSFSPPPRRRVGPPSLAERLSWLARELGDRFPSLEVRPYLDRLAVRDPDRGVAAILALRDGAWVVIDGSGRRSFDDPYSAIRDLVTRLGLPIDPLWLFEAMFPGVVR